MYSIHLKMIWLLVQKWSFYCDEGYKEIRSQFFLKHHSRREYNIFSKPISYHDNENLYCKNRCIWYVMTICTKYEKNLSRTINTLNLRWGTVNRWCDGWTSRDSIYLLWNKSNCHSERYNIHNVFTNALCPLHFLYNYRARVVMGILKPRLSISLLCKFIMSKIFQISYIFDRCNCSLSAATSVWYERDIEKDTTGSLLIILNS